MHFPLSVLVSISKARLTLSVKWGNHHIRGKLFVLSPNEVAEPQMNATCQITIVDTPISEFVGEAVKGNYLQNLFSGGSYILTLQNWAVRQGWATTKDAVIFTRRVCDKKKFVLKEWRNVDPSYFIATHMDGYFTREGISLILLDLSFAETKNEPWHTFPWHSIPLSS
jgi:hypothetical protein